MLRWLKHPRSAERESDPALPAGPLVPVAAIALGLALAASLLLPAFPAARWLRLPAAATVAVALFSQRWRPRGTFRVLGWCAAILAAGWADTGAGAPANAVFLLALLIGLFIRRPLAPWVQSRAGGWLVLLLVVGAAPLAIGFAARAVTPPHDSVLVRLDRAVYTLAGAWLFLAGLRACGELLRNWIRRASVRTKLIVAFGIFAVTPALLAFSYASLSGWIHSGELRASALTHVLEITSGGHGLIARVKDGPVPRSGADLKALVERERPVLLDRGLRAVALERRAGEWQVAGRFGGPDSLFLPAASPAADSGGVVQGLALRAGRIWWVETALWTDRADSLAPRIGSADSLAFQTFEPVDSTRMGRLTRALRCDAVLVGSPTITASESEITIGADRRRSGVRYRAAGGAIEVGTGRSPAGTLSDSAALDSLTGRSRITLVGGGRWARVTSLRQLGPGFNSGASPRCFVWTGSGWHHSAALLLVRSNFWESVALAGLGTGPFSNVMTFVLAFFIVLFFAVEVVSLAVGSRVASYITRGAAGLRDAAAAIGRGDFSVRVQVPSEDELGELAGSFNRMAEGLEEGQRAVLEREQMRRELELARRIQSRLLPPSPPDLPRLDVAAANAMSQQVGGDYYDFIPMREGRLGLCIADVAGKGVAAALLMSNVKAALNSSAAIETAPDRVAVRVNRLLEQSIEPGRFVTFFFGILDPAGLRLDYVNAGHPAPLLLRADGSTARLEAGGTVLGIDADAAYESGSITLSTGDLLALFTDGVTEAQGGGGDLFGEDRIEALLRAEGAQPAAGMLDRLLAAVRAYEGERGQSDDLTAIILRVNAA
jgi:serine phosphatase RsbU (regulator of sigma subunit)